MSNLRLKVRGVIVSGDHRGCAREWRFQIAFAAQPGIAADGSKQEIVARTLPGRLSAALASNRWNHLPIGREVVALVEPECVGEAIIIYIPARSSPRERRA